MKTFFILAGFLFTFSFSDITSLDVSVRGDITVTNTETEYNTQSEAPFIDGIGVGSRVIRGRDWHYDAQDGGEGKRGTVVELRAWKATPNKGGGGGGGGGEGGGRRGPKGNSNEDIKGWDGSGQSTIGVRVLWDETGQANTYRWTSLHKGEMESTRGPTDLEVVGWRAVSNDVLNSIRGYQDILLESTRKQMASIEAIMILRSLFISLGGSKWRAKSGWEEDNRRIEIHKRILNEELIKGQWISPDADVDLRLTATLNALRVNDPCTEGWEGISCRDGTIVGLDLSSNGVILQDSGSAQGSNGKGRKVLPPELWTLVEMGLVSINLSNNRGLEGTVLGDDAFCKGEGSLRFVDLSSCSFAGPLPPCLSKHASTLETVSLHGNTFEGVIPDEWNAMDQANGGVLRMLQLHNNLGLVKGKSAPNFLKSGILKASLPPQLRN